MIKALFKVAQIVSASIPSIYRVAGESGEEAFPAEARCGTFAVFKLKQHKRQREEFSEILDKNRFGRRTHKNISEYDFDFTTIAKQNIKQQI